MLLKKGDATTSVILFLAVILVAIILITWYIQAIRPTRAIIATVTDDMDELQQHIRNACGVTEYRATYALQTGNAQLLTNETHVCIITDIFGSCQPTACAVNSTTVPFQEEQILLRISKSAGDVVLELNPRT